MRFSCASSDSARRRWDRADAQPVSRAPLFRRVRAHAAGGIVANASLILR